MNITIVGGGNVGTQFAVHCAAKGHKVKIYSSNPDLFSNELEIVNSCGERLYLAKIESATNDPQEAFSQAELIFITTPAFLAQKVFADIHSYIPRNTYIGFIPGIGGMECVFQDCLKKGCKLFGLQRVPSVARLVEYGKKVCAEGYRGQLYVASLPGKYVEECCKIIRHIFDIPCDALPNYLNLTLTPSNPILHTVRLYSLFRDYYEGKRYAEASLFYEGWDMRSSDLLFLCDDEVQNICKALVDFDLSYVKSLKEHYESGTAQQLMQKIRSITAFKGIKTPLKEVDGGYIPDFSSRYFISDFAYGLTILYQVARFVQVPTPTIDMLLNWFRELRICNQSFDFSDYAITDFKTFQHFYSQSII